MVLLYSFYTRGNWRQTPKPVSLFFFPIRLYRFTIFKKKAESIALMYISQKDLPNIRAWTTHASQSVPSEATLCGPPPPNLRAGRIFPRPLTCMILHYKPGASQSLTGCSDDLDEGRQHPQSQVSVSSDASGSHRRRQRGKQEKRRLRVRAEKREERE